MKFALLFTIFAAALPAQVYTLSTFAGGGLPNNVAATSAPIGYVSSIASDPAGNVYFLFQNCVFRVDASTHILTLFAGTGVPGFTGDGGPATAAQLNSPIALATDSAGNVYIAETGRVREVSGGVISTVAGNGTSGTSGDNGPATAAEISPSALALDSAGNLYIANKVGSTLISVTPGGSAIAVSGSVREVSGGVISTVAGNGSCCTASRDNIPALSDPLYSIQGIGLDAAGNLYIATYGGNINSAAIRKVANGVITTAAPLAGVNGFAVDGEGNFYVTAQGVQGVTEISAGVSAVVAAGGTPPLNQPQGLALDAIGNLYVADTFNYLIRAYAHAALTTLAGDGLQSYLGEGGPATAAQLNGPAGLALDSSGNLYIADQSNSLVREVSGGIISTVPSTSGALLDPEGVALDAAGDLFIADSANNRVREVSQGAISTLAMLSGPPLDTAVDSSGNVYASVDPNSIVRIANGSAVTIAGGGSVGYSGDNGPATSAQLFQPYGMAVDSAGNLYFADSGNNRIRKTSNGIIATVAGTGVSGYSGDGGPATSAELSSPQGVALGASGNLYIADGASIRKVSGGIITMIAGTGTAGYSGENLPALGAQITPYRVAVDSAGNVYFSEREADRVRVLRPNAASCAFAVSPTNIVTGNAAANLSFTIQGTAGCAWTVSGLPSWIAYSGAGGIGSGTVTLAVAANTGAAQTATFTIAGIAVTVTQESPLTLATSSPLPMATTGTAYSQTFAASGGMPPYAWSLVSGSLPTGLTLTGAGALSGTPVAAGIFNFTIQVTDSASALASLTYNLTVIPPGGTPPPGSLVTHALPVRADAGTHPVVDSAGNVYVLNHYVPGSDQVTITPGAAQTQPGGGTCVAGPATDGPCQSAYIGKMDANGNLIFGTLLGGQTQTAATALTVDSAGNVYIAGTSFPGLNGGPFPTTPGAAIPTTTSTTTATWAAKLSASGSQFDYVTFLPSQLTEVTAMTVDASGDAYIGGSGATGATVDNGLVVALNASGTAILYTASLPGAPTAMTMNSGGNLMAAGNGTEIAIGIGPPVGSGIVQGIYMQTLGANGSLVGGTLLPTDPSDTVSAIATDSAGDVFLAGTTSSLIFPDTNSSVWPTPPVPLWSSGTAFGYVVRLAGENSYYTYVMGNGVSAMAVTADGEAYVAGTTLSGFPVTASAPQPCFGGNQDAFVAHLSANGATLPDATYVGANTAAAAMSLGSNGAVYLDTGAALAQVRFGDASYSPAACLTPTVLNAASQTPGAVPGAFVTLVGYGIGPQTGVVGAGGVQVFFDGAPAPVIYAQAQQVNVQAPFSLTGTTVVTLRYNGATFGPFSMPVSFADPEILRQQIGASTQAIAFNQDNTPNSASNPAAAGSVVYFLGTGFGQTSPGCQVGGANYYGAASLAGVTVTANGGAAPVSYAGSAPTLPCGIAQINMQVPAGTPSGTYGVQFSAQSGDNAVKAAVASTIVVK